MTKIAAALIMASVAVACATTNPATRAYEDGDSILFGFAWPTEVTVMEKSDGMIPVPHHDEQTYTVRLEGESGAQQVEIETPDGPFASFWLTPQGKFAEGIAAAGQDQATASKRAKQMWTAWVDTFVDRSLTLGKQTILTEDKYSRTFSVSKNDIGNIIAVMEQRSSENENIVIVSSEYADPPKGTLVSVHREVIRILDGKRKVLDEQHYTFK